MQAAHTALEACVVDEAVVRNADEAATQLRTAERATRDARERHQMTVRAIERGLAEVERLEAQ